MITRHPSAAGQYYPRDKESLEQTIDKISRRVRTSKRTVAGLLVPHSGIAYVGEAQAFAYKSITGSPIFVLIGTNHAGQGAAYSIMSQGAWTTPLGSVRIDSELANAIKNKTSYLQEDVSSFSAEHSIETHLPWLQKLFGNVEFVPISVSGREIEAYREIGSAIRDAAHETGRSVCVIASSDLTRYGESFGFVPVEGGGALEWMRETDAAVIEALRTQDVKRLLEAAAQTNICGLGAIVTMLYATMEVSTGGTLLHYGTTYPVSQTTNAVTSFAAVVME